MDQKCVHAASQNQRVPIDHYSLSIPCPLSHVSPRMTGGPSWLPPTITSVWESLATEGQDPVNPNATQPEDEPHCGFLGLQLTHAGCVSVSWPEIFWRMSLQISIRTVPCWMRNHLIMCSGPGIIVLLVIFSFCWQCVRKMVIHVLGDYCGHREWWCVSWKGPQDQSSRALDSIRITQAIARSKEQHKVNLINNLDRRGSIRLERSSRGAASLKVVSELLIECVLG